MWEQWVGLVLLAGVAFALILWAAWEHGYSRGHADMKRDAVAVVGEMSRQLDRRVRGVR